MRRTGQSATLDRSCTVIAEQAGYLIANRSKKRLCCKLVGGGLVDHDNIGDAWFGADGTGVQDVDEEVALLDANHVGVGLRRAQSRGHSLIAIVFRVDQCDCRPAPFAAEMAMRYT